MSTVDWPEMLVTDLRAYASGRRRAAGSAAPADQKALVDRAGQEKVLGFIGCFPAAAVRPQAEAVCRGSVSDVGAVGVKKHASAGWRRAFGAEGTGGADSDLNIVSSQKNVRIHRQASGARAAGAHRQRACGDG